MENIFFLSKFFYHYNEGLWRITVVVRQKTLVETTVLAFMVSRLQPKQSTRRTNSTGFKNIIEVQASSFQHIFKLQNLHFLHLAQTGVKGTVYKIRASRQELLVDNDPAAQG